MIDNLITVTEAAKELKVSPLTIRRYIANKTIKAVKIGKSWRINRTDLEKLLGTTPEVVSFYPQPGLNSIISETLFEIKDEIKTIAELKKIIIELDPDYLVYLQDIKSVKIHEIIIELLAKEAKSSLLNKQALHKDLTSGKTAVFLPLPPHIVDSVYLNIPKGFAFNTEERVPAHSRKVAFETIIMENLTEIIERLEDITAVIFDGKKINGKLLVRANLAPILHDLFTKNIEKIYFHKIPHLPKGQQFVSIEAPSNVEIIYI